MRWRTSQDLPRKSMWEDGWNNFVKWCGERLSERRPLPASDFTVALFAIGSGRGEDVRPHEEPLDGDYLFSKGESVQPLAHPVPGYVYGSASGN